METRFSVVSGTVAVATGRQRGGSMGPTSTTVAEGLKPDRLSGGEHPIHKRWRANILVSRLQGGPDTVRHPESEWAASRSIRRWPRFRWCRDQGQYCAPLVLLRLQRIQTFPRIQALEIRFPVDPPPILAVRDADPRSRIRSCGGAPNTVPDRDTTETGCGRYTRPWRGSLATNPQVRRAANAYRTERPSATVFRRPIRSRHAARVRRDREAGV